MQLYSFQEVDVVWLAQQDGALLSSDMGLGKSCAVLSAMRCLHQLDRQPLPALIVCPNSVKQPWMTEAATWFPDATPYVIAGGAQGRRKQLIEAREDPTALVIINFEAMKLHSRLAPYGSVRLIRCTECGGPDPDVKPSSCHKHPRELNGFPFRTVIVDEAHRQKDPRSQQTRACWAVQHQPTVTRRWALTGTPIATNVGDLWSVMHGVAPLDFPTKTEFIERFALVAWNRNAALDIVGVRPDTRHEFDAIVQPRLRRMLKDVVLPDLPPKVRVVREAPMTTKQARAYTEMEAELLTVLDDGDAVVAPSNLVKATRLLQFSSAYAMTEEVTQTDGTVKTLVKLAEPSPKLDVLEEVLDELGQRQVAVCALSRQLIELAAARLDSRPTRKLPPVTYRLLTGHVPEHQRASNIRDFQEGRARCMLFTVQAGGVGVTLTAADTIVFLQRSWSMVDNKQAEDRVHRIGSQRHESITVVDIVAPETIEVRQLQRLAEKAAQLEQVVRDRERRLAAGYSIESLDELERELTRGHLL